MLKWMLDRTARVAVIESNSAARSLLCQVLKEAGFKDPVPLDSVKAAVEFFEVESADWVITPIMPDQPITALHFLDLIATQSLFERTRVSLLVEDTEMNCLQKAFELGALSWHTRSFTRDSLSTDITNFLKRLEYFGGQDTLLSAEILGNLLLLRKQHKSFLSLRTRVFELHPDSPDALLGLAEAQFLNQMEEAKQTLGRAKLLECPGWEALATKYMKDEDLKPDLGVSQCVLVEPDEATASSIAAMIEKSGTKVEVFHCGEAAFNWCQKNPKIDLVMHEWKVPGLAGPSLVQRLRHTLQNSLPIVVISSLVSKTDLPLLNEMGVANVIEKPVREKEFISTIARTVQQELAPTLPSSLERKIQQLLELGNKEDAERFKDKLLGLSDCPEGTRAYVEGVWAFYANDFKTAKLKLMESIQKGADQAKAFNLLGKTFTKLKDLPSAAKCLMKAQEISPKNIARLCELAAVQAEMGEAEASKKTLESAKKVDAGSQVVKKEEVKVALVTGDVATAKQAMISVNADAIVAEMNNTAVAFIFAGHYEKATDLYQRTIEALPPNSNELHARVAYNLALAHARNKDLKKSKDALTNLKVAQSLFISKKIVALTKKVDQALKSGGAVQLSGGKAVAANTEELKHLMGDFENQITVGESAEGANKQNSPAEIPSHWKPAIRCCFLVYKETEALPKDWEEKLKTKPQFKRRSAIEREEGMGLERMMKG